MKLTIWEGIKLGAWLITAFLVVLMVTVYFLDYKDSSMDVIFYFNKIFIIVFMWGFIYFAKFLHNKISKTKYEK
tara:strand:+ start:506 stop:727 length:222 start_codon:yes stop_codon:yes gene_type:complete